MTITKANYVVRVGDTIGVSQGGFYRTVRLLGLGCRRGPAAEARGLYEEIGAAARICEFNPVWRPLLVDEDESQNGTLS